MKTTQPITTGSITDAKEKLLAKKYPPITESKGAQTYFITENQYVSLTHKIYEKLMESDEMGMGEMGECRDESIRIVEEWMEENSITFELQTA